MSMNTLFSLPDVMSSIRFYELCVEFNYRQKNEHSGKGCELISLCNMINEHC